MTQPQPPVTSGDPTPSAPVEPPQPAATPAAPSGTPDDRPLGPAGEKALAAERDARKALEKQLSDLRTGLASALGVEAGNGKDAVATLTEQVTVLQRGQADAEQRALRLEVAQEKGLTAAQAARLVGTTKEEMAADADTLLSLFPAGATPAGGTPSATPGEPTPPKAPAPDPSQGAKGTPPAARAKSLTEAIAAQVRRSAPGG